MLLLNLWVLFSLTTPHAFAADCRIQRPPNTVRDPDQSFARYVASERACGVRDDALPYILHANSQKPFRGTIVMVHGLSGSPWHLRQMAERLQSQGYNVVAPILEGHGKDDAFLATASLDRWQKDLKYAGDIAEQLGKPVFIGGHSTGGAIAALEAASSPGKYKAMFGLDPALNLSESLESATPAACIATKISNLTGAGPVYEDDPIPCMLTGTPHVGDERYVREVKDVVVKTVKEHCGANFPIPTFNTRYTLPGVCALSKAVEKLKTVSPQSLPPTLAIESSDDTFYGPRVSKERLEDFVTSTPGGAIVRTNTQVHNLMGANCGSTTFDSNVKEIDNWLRKKSRP